MSLPGFRTSPQHFMLVTLPSWIQKEAIFSNLYIYKIGSQLIFKNMSYISNIFPILATGLFQFWRNILVFSEQNGHDSNKDDV